MKVSGGILTAAAITGFAGIVMMGLSKSLFLPGLTLFVAAIVLVLFGLNRQNAPSGPVRRTERNFVPPRQMPQVPPQQKITGQFDVRPPEKVLPPQPVTDHSLLGQLLTALRSQGVNVRAPIVFGADNQPALTVTQIIQEIASIADAQGKSAQDMLPHAMKMYERMWEHVEKALSTHHGDMILVKVFIATNTLIDVQGIGGLKEEDFKDPGFGI